VSLHVPLTAGDHDLIDKRALTRMKAVGVFDQHARGPVVTRRRWRGRCSIHLLAGAAPTLRARAGHPFRTCSRSRMCCCAAPGAAADETRTADGDLAADNVLAVLAARAAADAGPLTANQRTRCYVILGLVNIW